MALTFMHKQQDGAHTLFWHIFPH